MSEWIVDTTRYEESYPLTGREQVVALLGCDLVAEVTRCRDCVMLACDDGRGGMCTRDGMDVPPDGWCAWGVRRVTP